MQGMSVIVKKIAQLMSGLIFVYGIYIITHGHLTPGGGFAGGALVAGAFILLILANGSEYIN
jgi:multisubunit Na+/H+ antiporter MnhB subunit